MTRHAVWNVECPTCERVKGPCESTPEQAVAWPVYVLEGPASMSKLTRVARALRVLHGPDLRHEHDVEGAVDRHVWYTPGPTCNCRECDDRLDSLIEGPHGA